MNIFKRLFQIKSTKTQDQIHTDGIYWADTGELKVEGIPKRLLSVIRFYEDGTLAASIFTADDLPSTVEEVAGWFNKENNSVSLHGHFECDNAEINLEYDNEQYCQAHPSNAPITCQAHGTCSNNATVVHLGMKYFHQAKISKSFYHDGEYDFNFKASNFDKR